MANLLAFEKRFGAAQAASLSMALALLGACASAAPATQPASAGSAKAAPAAPPRASKPRPFISPHSYEWFVRAEVLMARGAHEGAVAAYRMALAGAEEDPYVLARLSLALEATGDRHGADRAVTRGLALDARSEAVWLARARIAEGRGALPETLHALERAEAAAPLSPAAPRAMARLLAAGGGPERALAVRKRHAARLPRDSREAARAALDLALLRQDGAGLAEAAQRWLASAGSDAGLLEPTIRRLLNDGQTALALRLARALPDTPRTTELRLSALLAAGRAAEAEALLALTSPDVMGGPVALAEAYLAVQRPDRALSLIGDAGGVLEPGERHRVALVRGEALLRTGQAAHAARVLGQVPRGSRFSARARELLAEAAAALGRPALARELAERAQ